MPDSTDATQVGYGKPPTETQFKKGQSGNPKGRPKGSRNLATIILNVGRERIRVNGPRGTRLITKSEAMMTQLANQAIQGNQGAARIFVPLILQAEQSVREIAPHQQEIHAIDTALMRNLARRFGGFPPAQKAIEKDDEA